MLNLWTQCTATEPIRCGPVARLVRTHCRSTVIRGTFLSTRRISPWFIVRVHPLPEHPGLPRETDATCNAISSPLFLLLVFSPLNSVIQGCELSDWLNSN